MITGEPVPVPKKPGERVTGATLNGNGSLVMRAERVGADTLLARIVHMVGRRSARAPRCSAWPISWPPISSAR